MLLPAAAMPTTASAQVRPDLPRPPLDSPWPGLLTEAARLVVTPAVDAFTIGASRVGLDAGIRWERDVSAVHVARLGLDFGAAWRARNAYRRTGVNAGFGIENERSAAAIQLTAGVGSGDGPGTVFSAEASGELGVLRMNVRSSMLRQDRPALDSLPPPAGAPGRVPGELTLQYTDAELSAHRRLGALRTAATLGARFGEDRGGQNPWAFAEIIAPLHGQLGLQLAAGWQPERRDLAQPAGAFARVAFRLEVRGGETAPAVAAAPERSPTFAVMPLESGAYQLSTDCESAHVVELKGDVTDWEPVALRRASGTDGRCSVLLRAEPGVYYVVMRINGGSWSVPPGLMPVPDGFGGLAGLLSLPPPVLEARRSES